MVDVWTFCARLDEVFGWVENSKIRCLLRKEGFC